MDYIKKMENMLLSDYGMEEVAENMYLNYQSVINTDEVYKLRKAISIKYKCNLNDVKLIGSAHTGYTYKDNQLLKRDNPKDYDFAIINSDVFVRAFHKVNHNKLIDKSRYMNYVLKGKIHPLYADKRFLNSLENMNKGIMNNLNVKKHVSVCFYLSEKDFISGLVEYNRKLYAGLLKKLKTVGSEGISQQDKIVDLKDLSAVKDLSKLEG